jgi:thiamine transporter ThiT
VSEKYCLQPSFYAALMPSGFKCWCYDMTVNGILMGTVNCVRVLKILSSKQITILTQVCKSGMRKSDVSRTQSVVTIRRGKEAGKCHSLLTGARNVTFCIVNGYSYI